MIKKILLPFIIVYCFVLPPPMYASESSTVVSSDSALSSGENSSEDSTSEAPSLSSDSKVLEEATTDSSSSTDSTSISTSDNSAEEVGTENTINIAADVFQNGTTTYPYLVSTSAELKAAINQAKPTSDATGNITKNDPLTIKFLTDITYTSSDAFIISKNTVIDGDNHSLLYTSASYGTSSLLQVNTGGVSATIKNMNYGNSTYPNNTYYGIISTGASNVSVNIENVTYNITNGAQPFYADKGKSNNTLNFSGVNTFNQSVDASGSYGGEFVEGYSTINFAANSTTTVKNNSGDAWADFWPSSSMTINLGDNATFDMTSGKPYVFYGTNNNIFNIGENAKLAIRKSYASRTGSINQINDNSSRTTTMNVASGGSADITTGIKPLDLGTFNVNATDSGTVNFAKTGSNFANQAFSSGTLKFTNAGTNVYQVLSTSTSNTNSSSIVTPPNSLTASLTNQNIISYQPAMSISGVSGSSNVGDKKSQITASVSGFSSSLPSGWVYQTEYLVSKKRYYNSANNILDQSGLTTDFKSSTKPSGVKTVAASGSGGVGTINDLLAMNYYVYGRVTATSGSNIASTPWYETQVDVPKHTATVFSNSLGFTSPGSKILNDATDYRIVSYSNTPTAISLTRVTTGDGSDESIQLVDSFSVGSENLLTLNVLAKLSNSNTIWSLANPTGTLILQPYFETDSSAALSLTGAYAGHFNHIKNVNYLLDFTIQNSS
ncbi:hypothetical protein ACQKTA_10325 [Enterococcus sp. 22-H-5-01]|uniref:hypothetical protein n=1 Tax=Enterococcus sp. 22-H-5-01 TaxID=3418555 RepID=UPI003D031EDB